MQINTEKNHKEKKLHGSYKFPVNMSLEKIQNYENGSFMWHWHPEIEITLILSGEIEYYVNDEKFILSAGDGIFCNSNALHSGNITEKGECTYLSITFHPRFIYGYDKSIIYSKYVNPLIYDETFQAIRLDKEDKSLGNILRLMEIIHQEYLNKEENFELHTQINLMKIWEEVYKYFQNLPKAESKSPKKLQRLRDIITYIQENYSEELELEDISENVGLCKSECCRFFKKHMNMTIFDYVLYVRIQESIPLLLNGASVTKVSGEVGFSSPSYYTQIFKRYMNCTPKEYKKREDD